MPSISDYFKYSETAFAAYALNLASGQGNIAKYTQAGMSPSQAQRFDTNWQVLGQQDLWNGFSAVLLQPVDSQGNPSGQKVLAIRGTEVSVIDYAVDVVSITVLGGTIGMQQYASLESFYQSLIAENSKGPGSIFPLPTLKGSASHSFWSRHATSPTH